MNAVAAAPHARTVALPSYTAGPQAYDAFAATVRPLGERLYVIGGQRALEAGLPRLTAALPPGSVHIAAVYTVQGLCTMAQAERLAQSARQSGAQVIAGMGGGRAIDLAKAAAHLARLPVVTLPTIAATCAAVTALSVLYGEDGRFERFLFLAGPPAHAFIHTGVMAAAPACYLRAGMGDCLVKYFESHFSARGDMLDHRNALGLALAAAAWEAVSRQGPQALEDCKAGVDSPPLQDVVLSNIVTTGLVSLLVDEAYNGALAHALYYALEDWPQLPAGNLHGDIVAWGAIVQLLLDGQTQLARSLCALLEALGIARTLAGMGIQVDEPVLRTLEGACAQPDMAHVPYAVTPAMVRGAVLAAEGFSPPAKGGDAVV